VFRGSRSSALTPQACRSHVANPVRWRTCLEGPAGGRIENIAVLFSSLLVSPPG
jgi:hypothetical protein